MCVNLLPGDLNSGPCPLPSTNTYTCGVTITPRVCGCMFINQLKGMVMELSNWGSDVELMKYLLKNTKEMERAIIIYSQTVPTNLIIELRKYKTPPTELVCYHKSSKFVRQVSNRHFDI